MFFKTAVYASFVSFIQSLWGDTVGKIFILTFVGYSASYMMYSGYLSWFAGGYGGLLLSQVGFTATDFLSLIPTAFVLLIESFWSTLRFVLKVLFYLLLLPAGIAFIVVTILHMG